MEVLCDIDIYVVPDMLQTEISVTSTEMADGTCGVASRMEMTGGSPLVEIDISRGPDMLHISVTAMEIAGGSPPANIDIYVVPDMLQTEISVTTTEIAGGSPPADIDICVIPDMLPIVMSVKTVMSDMLMEMDTPDVSRLEVAGGSPLAEIDINGSPDVLQRAVSMTAVVSGKWMETGEVCHEPKKFTFGWLRAHRNPARRSSDVNSDGCVIQDPIPTVVSVRIVVTEEWMDRFVLDLVECPSVSRTSAVAGRSSRLCLRSIPLLFFSGGQLPMHTPVCRRHTAQVSGLQLIK